MVFRGWSWKSMDFIMALIVGVKIVLCVGIFLWYSSIDVPCRTLGTSKLAWKLIVG